MLPDAGMLGALLRSNGLDVISVKMVYAWTTAEHRNVVRANTKLVARALFVGCRSNSLHDHHVKIVRQSQPYPTKKACRDQPRTTNLP